MSTSSLALRNIGLSKKLSMAVAIFLLPVALLCYFLIIEKDDLITFTQMEISGVDYLRPATTALAVLTDPGASKDDLRRAIEGLKDAETKDAGTLSVTQKGQDAIAAIQSVIDGKPVADATGKITDLISTVSDNSNITLDPDTDGYFVGDSSVNQAPGVLIQTYTMIGAAKDLAAEPSDDHKIAYAEARDGMISSTGNLATDMSKAIKANTDGSAQGLLDAPTKVVASAAEALTAAAAKPEDRNALLTATNNLHRTTAAFVQKR